MGTLKTTNIQTITGSGTLTLGTSGETLTVPTGVTVGGLMSNTPAFSARPNANQSIASTSFVKLSFQTENFDTDNAFDNSTNYRFTVPTGKAGKYYFEGTYLLNSNDDKMYISYLYKNGSRLDNSIGKEVTGGGASSAGATSSIIIDLAVGDYMEYYVYHSSGANRDTLQNYCYFAGYRLLGS